MIYVFRGGWYIEWLFFGWCYELRLSWNMKWVEAATLQDPDSKRFHTLNKQFRMEFQVVQYFTNDPRRRNGCKIPHFLAGFQTKLQCVNTPKFRWFLVHFDVLLEFSPPNLPLSHPIPFASSISHFYFIFLWVATFLHHLFSIFRHVAIANFNAALWMPWSAMEKP